MVETPLVRLQRGLGERGVDAVVLAAPETLSPVNVRYVSGFTGSSSYLVVGRDQAYLLTDFRYTEQAAVESPAFQVMLHQQPVERSIAAVVQDAGWRNVGFEANHITHRMYQNWAQALPQVEWHDVDGLVTALRTVKTASEIDAMRRAAAIADEALAVVLPTLRGRSEVAAARHLEREMLARGADRIGFGTILVAGTRGSLPHGKPSERVIQDGDLVTIDFGANWHGYHSDETVTVAVGETAAWQREIFDLVQQAQQAGIDTVRPGARASAVDGACRTLIEAAGHGPHFGHGTGHGVGLEVHEAPFCSGRAGAPDWVLEAGMTVTVEPGVYLPGQGGVRLEDTLVVTTAGSEPLTRWPKQWTVI